MPVNSASSPLLPNVTELFAKLDKAGATKRGSRSPLYLWFRQNHLQLAARFKRYPPAWNTLAAQLAEQGVRDANGNPPTAISARDAWYRARMDVDAMRAKRLRPKPALEPGEIAPGVHALGVPALPALADGTAASRARPKVEIDFQPGRPQSLLPEPAPVRPVRAASLPLPRVAQHRTPEEARDYIEQVRGELGGRNRAGYAMPKKVE